MDTTGQPGHRHGITKLQRGKDIRRAVASVIVITGYLRTGDSDFTVDLHRRSRPTNSCTETMTAHANRRPHARTTDSSDSDDDHHNGICRTCANRARQPAGTSDTPGRSDYRIPSRDQNSSRRHHRYQTEISAPKWPPQQTTRRRCRKPRGKDVAIHWSSGCGRLRDDAPKKEEDVKASSSPDLEDLRFPSGAKAAGRGRSTTQQQRFQEKARRPRASPSPDPAEAGHRISPGDAQPPPARINAANEPHPAEADLELAVGSRDPPCPDAHTTPQPKPLPPNPGPPPRQLPPRRASKLASSLAPSREGGRYPAPTRRVGLLGEAGATHCSRSTAGRSLVQQPGAVVRIPTRRIHAPGAAGAPPIAMPSPPDPVEGHQGRTRSTRHHAPRDRKSVV